jgi:IstB-like ATP binding protein
VAAQTDANGDLSGGVRPDQSRRPWTEVSRHGALPDGYIPGPLRPPGQGQRQREGGGAGEVHLNDPAAARGLVRGVECGAYRAMSCTPEPGKTHLALALDLAACQRGFSVSFITAASLAVCEAKRSNDVNN